MKEAFNAICLATKKGQIRHLPRSKTNSSIDLCMCKEEGNCKTAGSLAGTDLLQLDCIQALLLS
eukprot:6063139-Amphidinium_carterae.1